MEATRHVWRFFRAGGFDQIRIDRGADLACLDELDLKLWVALSCPTRGIELPARTLELIDSDRDQRIKAPEVIAAVKWAVSTVKSPDHLFDGAASLPLEQIQEESIEGRLMAAAAKHALVSLGKPEAASITPDEVVEATKRLQAAPLNGDGILPPEVVEDPEARTVVEEILTCVGGEVDGNGRTGVNQARVDRFFTEALAFAAWHARSEADAATVLPLGTATPAAADTFRSLQAKGEDYFARCRLAAFDARAVAALNGQDADFAAIAAKMLDGGTPEVRGLPLARIEPDRPLPLLEGVNPAWAGELMKLRDEVVIPLLGERDRLTGADWATLVDRLAPYEKWRAEQAGTDVAALGITRVKEILAGGSRQTLEALITRDRELEPEVKALADLEKLALFHRDIVTLVENFVSFQAFYGRREKAIFQVGTLYLDERSCDLCVRIEDMGKHATLANLARTYLAYCECTRKTTGEQMIIAAAFTAGDADDLIEGRNGLFVDRQGRHWDATIVKILNHPISIRQAFWSPYKTIAGMIEGQVEKLASSREKASIAAAGAHLETGAKEIETPADKAKAKKEAFDVAKFAGIFAAIGLALGAIGTMIISVVSGFMALSWWQMPLALLAILLLVSGPAMVMAWLKLRRRSLAPILDACGWAVNARAKINIPFGGALTGLAQLPPGAQRDLVDPFAESHAVRNRVIAAAVLLVLLSGLWYFGVLNRLMPWLPESRFVEWLEESVGTRAVAPAGGDAAPAGGGAAPAGGGAAPAGGGAAPAAPASGGGAGP